MAEGVTPERCKGAIYYRVLGEREIVVYPMIFTTRICIGDVGADTYSRAWCYENMGDALVAATNWDGEGDPPGPWVKEAGTERRRAQ